MKIEKAMKVRLKKTGQLLDVQEARAKYWERIGYATIVEEKEKAEKVTKPTPKKQAVKKEKPTKQAKEKTTKPKSNGNTSKNKGTSKD